LSLEILLSNVYIIILSLEMFHSHLAYWPESSLTMKKIYDIISI